MTKWDWMWQWVARSALKHGLLSVNGSFLKENNDSSKSQRLGVAGET